MPRLVVIDYPYTPGDALLAMGSANSGQKPIDAARGLCVSTSGRSSICIPLISAGGGNFSFFYVFFIQSVSDDVNPGYHLTMKILHLMLLLQGSVKLLLLVV